MRLHFTAVGGSGHLGPMLPIARAAQDAGHSVAVAAQPAMRAMAEATDVPFLAAGPNDKGPLPSVLLAHSAMAARHADLHRLCVLRRPDLLVVDELDTVALKLADRLGLLSATVLVFAAGGDEELPISRYLSLAPFPPRFRHPAFPLPLTAHPISPLPAVPWPDTPVPVWLTNRDDAPLVYLTLGTVFSVLAGARVFPLMLEGLRELPAEIVVTVGRRFEPATLGPQPRNVRIERFIPQSMLLPRASLVVCHGGSGTVMGALGYGVSLVVLPLGADTFLNAARCAELGTGLELDPFTVTPAVVRYAAAAVLGASSYQHAAAGMRNEIAALPGPTHAVTLLERLMAERRPIVRPGALWEAPPPHSPPADRHHRRRAERRIGR